MLLSPSDLLRNKPPIKTKLHLQRLTILRNFSDYFRKNFYLFGNLTIDYSSPSKKI